MKGVTIMDHDDKGILTFDLRDILLVLGDDAERSAWSASAVECIGGDAASKLHRASETGEQLTGIEFIAIARDVGQVIDGEFSGRLPGNVSAWITIRAVDSSAFDVLTDRDVVLDKLRQRFVNVTDIPQ